MFVRDVLKTIGGTVWFLSSVALAVFAVTCADPVMDGTQPVWVAILCGIISIVSISCFATFLFRESSDG